jgi:hypothetical protein
VCLGAEALPLLGRSRGRCVPLGAAAALGSAAPAELAAIRSDGTTDPRLRPERKGLAPRSDRPHASEGTAPRSHDPHPEIRQIPRSHTCRFPYGNLPVAGSAALPKGRASASKATDEASFGRSAGAQADSRRGRTRNAQREAYDCPRRGHNAVGRANGREGGRANGRVSNVTSTFAVTRIDCHWGGVSFDRHPHRVGGDDRPCVGRSLEQQAHRRAAPTTRTRVAAQASFAIAGHPLGHRYGLPS